MSTVATLGNGIPVNGFLGSGVLVMAASTLGRVAFTTTGSSFSPTVSLAGGSSAVVTWQSNTGTTLATGVAPTISFGSTAVRTVRMHCTDYAAVRTVNLGFSASDDAGRVGPGSGHNKAAQACSGVTGLTALTGLTMFMAANGNLTGALDLTGLSNLLYVECYFAQLTSITLTGCTSLLRLCLEANHITAIDLNPVAANLTDLRMAIQWYPTFGHTLTPATLTANMAALWHYCVRDQSVSNTVPYARLPVVEQHWAWNSGQTTTDAPISTVLRDLDDHDNSYSQASINALLVAMDTNHPTGTGTINLLGNAAPSGAGATAKAALISRSWTVTTT